MALIRDLYSTNLKSVVPGLEADYLVLNEKITVLILANCIWAGHCFTQVWNHYSNFSIFGSLHLGFEGIYVIVLAYFEARFLLARFLYESNT